MVRLTTAKAFDPRTRVLLEGAITATLPHSAAGHHLHQHHQRKDERDAGKHISPDLADEIGVDEPDRSLGHPLQARSLRPVVASGSL